MLKGLGLVSVAIAGAAIAQVTSYETNRPAEIKGDPDKIVCKKQEKLGTRLGEKRVCLTVREWREVYEADREITERIQSGVRVCANPPCGS
jgi:hypothetical protein